MQYKATNFKRASIITITRKTLANHLDPKLKLNCRCSFLYIVHFIKPFLNWISVRFYETDCITKIVVMFLPYDCKKTEKSASPVSGSVFHQHSSKSNIFYWISNRTFFRAVQTFCPMGSGDKEVFVTLFYNE